MTVMLAFWLLLWSYLCTLLCFVGMVWELPLEWLPRFVVAAALTAGAILLLFNLVNPNVIAAIEAVQ